MGLYIQTQMNGHIPERKENQKTKYKYNQSPFDILDFKRSRNGIERVKLEHHWVSYSYKNNHYFVADELKRYVLAKIDKTELMDWLVDNYPGHFL